MCVLAPALIRRLADMEIYPGARLRSWDIGVHYSEAENIKDTGEAPKSIEMNTSEASELSSLLRGYYQNGAVRERMREFLGGADLQKETAVYVVGNEGFLDVFQPASVSRLQEYLRAGMEVERSLWDHRSLIVDIDLEYDNFDFPAAAWVNPERAFALQQPVLDATLRFMGHCGLAPLILLSGRGYHLVWAVSRNSRAFRRLVGLGRVAPSLEARYAQPCSPNGKSIDHDLGRAFAGLGLILEFVGHRVLAASAAECPVPVQLTSIEVGPGIQGREIVSFDLSEYGDPLHRRHIRPPFSAYLKPSGSNGRWARQEFVACCPSLRSHYAG